MDEALLEKLFAAVLACNGPAGRRVVIQDGQLITDEHSMRLAGTPDVAGVDVDDGLRELVGRDWVRGTREQGTGSVVWWSELLPTVAGLRHFGEWPPEGLEYLPGGWDHGTWGTIDRAVLRGLQESAPPGNLVARPSIGEAGGWDAWDGCLRLHEAGLIGGDQGDGYIASVRVTTAGRDALEPAADDPLRRARLMLTQGAKADAVTAAIDEALKPRLLTLAARTLKADDVRGPLSVLNDQLRKHGAYGDSSLASEAIRAQIGAWLKLRNVVDHGEGAVVAELRIALMIDGIEQLLNDSSMAGV